MDIQSIIAYGIVIAAFGVVIRSAVRAINGKFRKPSCPGCKVEGCAPDETQGVSR